MGQQRRRKKTTKKNCIDTHTAIWGGLIHSLVFFFNYFLVGNPAQKKKTRGAGYHFNSETRRTTSGPVWEDNDI